MAALCYLLIATLVGLKITDVLFDHTVARSAAVNAVWLRLPTAFGAGVLVCTWVLYLVAYALFVQCDVQDPLLYANVLVVGTAATLLVTSWTKRDKIPAADRLGIPWVCDRTLFTYECIIYGALFLFVAFTMIYVFHQTGNDLKCGYTVFSDYAPHLAMIRSFSKEANFPTQYPHFGGADIKYHFMFQFLVGNLEYLGLRLDYAYNLASTLSLWGFLVLAGQLALRLSKNVWSIVLMAVFFVFRSGTAIFRYVAEHLHAGDLLDVLRTNTTFIGYTTNETWGLWNYNVYLNQRHLGFGLLLLCVMLWIFLDGLDSACASPLQGKAWWKERLFTKAAWLPARPKQALLCGVLLGLASFWNGAAVIGTLLLLFGIALFSDHRLDLALVAVLAVFFSILQTKFFISGNAVSPVFQWGFISEDKSLLGILWYLVQVTGISILGLLFAVIPSSREERCLIATVFIPVIFSFCVSLTPDVTVNHKYIMISMAVAAILWSVLLPKLFVNWQRTLLAFVLAFLLTATGLYDFVIIIRNNGEGHRVMVAADSALTKWLNQNLTSEDLSLTPEYYLSEFTMSGTMMYMGWPYYSWSAGYDTASRAAYAKEMYSTDSSERLRELVKQEGITYIVYEDGMTFEEQACQESVIAMTYPMVYQSEDGRIRIYETI